MEIIIVLVAITAVGIAWAVGKSKDKSPIDTWEPPKEMHLADKDKSWPYGEKLSEGKIHVNTADIAPRKSPDDRVEAPAPVVEQPPAKAPAKRAPAKKKSV